MKKIATVCIFVSIVFAANPLTSFAQLCGPVGQVIESLTYGCPLPDQRAHSFSMLDYIFHIKNDPTMRNDFTAVVLANAKQKGISLQCTDKGNLIEFVSKNDSFTITRTLWLIPEEGFVLVTIQYVKYGKILNNDPWLSESIGKSIITQEDFEYHARMAADLIKENVGVPYYLSAHLKENMHDDANLKIFIQIMSSGGLEIRHIDNITVTWNHRQFYSLFYGKTPTETYERSYD